MQACRVFSSKLAAIVGSLVIAACLTFTPSPSPSLYEAARGFSTAGVSSTASNVASKGDRLTSSRLRTIGRIAARPEGATAKRSGKIPIGCEAAVSRLIRTADFSARRCVT
jgi:hypothetical protein